jgi:hypothetical protein
MRLHIPRAVYCQLTVIGAAVPIPEALLALTEKVTDITLDLLSVHVGPVIPAQVAPVHT